jgi:hypothetical protein
MANKFELSGGGIQIEYILGGNPTFPSLTFTEGATKKTFTPAEITTDTSGLGTLVSVALVRTVDTGGTRFGFFLPDVPLTRGQSAPVTTVGGSRRSAAQTAFRAVQRPGKAYSYMVSRRK